MGERKSEGAQGGEEVRAVACVVESARLLPCDTGSLECWWLLQWMMATSLGAWRASSNLFICGPLTTGIPLVVRNSLSCQSMCNKVSIFRVWIDINPLPFGEK